MIALWLGHESIETTQTYLRAHLALKEAALAMLQPYRRAEQIRFRANDESAVSGRTMPNGTEPMCIRRPKVPRQPRIIPKPFGIVRRSA